MPHIDSLLRRQINPDDNPDDGDYWYYSETAWIIKWVVAGLIVLFLVLFIGGGYWHAQRRIKKGLRPLRYHMWLVPRRQRAQFMAPPPVGPVYYHPQGYGYPGQAYQMQPPQGPAPPAYNEEWVPAYTPPSKVNPDQNYSAVPLGSHPDAGSSSMNAGNPSGPAHPERAISPQR